MVQIPATTFSISQYQPFNNLHFYIPHSQFQKDLPKNRLADQIDLIRRMWKKFQLFWAKQRRRERVRKKGGKERKQEGRRRFEVSSRVILARIFALFCETSFEDARVWCTRVPLKRAFWGTRRDAFNIFIANTLGCARHFHRVGLTWTRAPESEERMKRADKGTRARGDLDVEFFH